MMDAGNHISSGVTVVTPGAASSYYTRADSEIGKPDMNSPFSEKKKRGRPRKYKPDGQSNRMLSPVQLSSSAPPVAGKSYMDVEKTPTTGRTVNSERKQKSKIGSENLDHWLDCSTGSSFLPHVITINAGEDISAKIMEFAQQGPRSVCVVSGSGSVLSVTLRLPSSSGGTVTYEGLFEILSLTGSFSPSDSQSSKSGGSGTMTMTLSGPDGRVVGGLIAGRTTAATTVKVVVTSFLLSSPSELKSKKQCALTTSGTGGLPDSRNVHGFSYTDSESPSDWSSAEKMRQDINISLQG